MEKSSFLKSVTEEGKENDDHSPQVDNKPKYDGKKQYWTDFLNLHLEKSNIFQMPGSASFLNFRHNNKHL